MSLIQKTGGTPWGRAGIGVLIAAWEAAGTGVVLAGMASFKLGCMTSTWLSKNCNLTSARY